MKLTFLQAQVPLTKSYTQKAPNQLEKTPYPMLWEFTSIPETATNLPQLEALLKKHAALGHCMLKGNVQRPLKNESRAGSTDSTADTELLVLDLDGLFEISPSGAEVNVTVPQFMTAIGLGDVSYVVQFSASYGITNDRLRAHIFVFVSKPHAAPLLKQWLMQLNHEVAMLRDSMGLTKTGNAISWALDVSACQNDKLIYIAPPVLKGLKDPMAGKQRIVYVKKKHDVATLSATINSTTRNRELTVKAIEKLRDLAGLPKRKVTYRMHGNTEVMVKPDSCTITGEKHERGWVYFNLNGGDSWAYFHPEDNPDYIYNFKGENAYLTKELLPDYWSKLSQASTRTSSSGLTYLAFCDRKTSAYYRGTFDEKNRVLDIAAAKNETQLRHFAKQHGMPLGDFIPEWNLVFDPNDTVPVDFTNKVINTFEPSVYMRATAREVSACPKTIFKVISHALGGDPVTINHFMNWVAYILQERDRTKTAWILHGTPGTGKGILMHNILRPIFGKAQTAVRRMEELNEPYNHFMKNSLLVFVDEVQTKALQNERGVMAKLKNFITEESVAIRQMYANASEFRNFSNWIFASNMSDPVSIDKEDRRFNVGKYQPNKLQITDKEIQLIERELQTFHDYLLYFKLDKALAGTVLDSEDRSTMISISESSIDSCASALLEGRFKFLIDQLPTDSKYDTNKFSSVEDYRTCLKTLLDRTDMTTGDCSVSRDELHVIFQYVCGNMPQTPNKFTTLLKHHRIHTKVVWVADAGKAVNGIKVAWKDLSAWQTFLDLWIPPAPKRPKLAAVASK